MVLTERLIFIVVDVLVFPLVGVVALTVIGQVGKVQSGPLRPTELPSGQDTAPLSQTSALMLVEFVWHSTVLDHGHLP